MKLLISLLLILKFVVCCSGQCVTVDSVFYQFTSGTTTLTTFPGFSWLPRTNATLVTTPLYAEGRSANPKLAASSTTIYSSATTKSNVFFGGDDNTHGHANTQILTRKSYSLLDGSITVKGTFLNRDGDPNYNESYVGIVPSNYTYYSPLDNDLNSSAGRQGIVLGAVATSSSAYLFDHGNTTQTSKVLKGPVSHGINQNKWFTIEVTFQVIGNHLYIVKGIYSDGTSNQPFGSMIDLGLVSNYNWLDKVSIVWGIDDLLADVTVIKKDCSPKKCRTEDSLIYDLSPANITRWPTPPSNNITSIDFSQVSTPLAIESVATNDNAYNNSNLIINPSGNRSTVYFGGDAPSPEAQHSACISSSKTFNLFTGPITVEAEFYNRQDVPLYNESYLAIVPKNYTWNHGWIKGNSDFFEGIRIGARPYATLIIDGQGPNSPDLVIQPLTNHNLAKNGEWYKMKTTFDTSNGKLIISLLQINNGSGYKNIATVPIIIGDVSKYPWLNELRVQALADDLIDTIKIKKLNCLTLCKISSDKALNFCNSDKQTDLKNHFQLNGKNISASDGIFKIIAFNNNPSHNYINDYKLNNSSIFKHNLPSGVWRINFISGCGSIDSIEIKLTNKPIISLKPVPFLCIPQNNIDLNTWIDSIKPKNATIKWFGNNVTGNMLNPATAKDSAIIRSEYVNCIINDPNGCADTIRNIPYILRKSPSIIINNKPYKSCEDQLFSLTSSSKYGNGVLWEKINLSDGNILNPGLNTTQYRYGFLDSINQSAFLKISTQLFPNDPCPVASDSVQLQIIRKPIVDFTDSLSACAPHLGVFISEEKSGKTLSTLKYLWELSNGASSITQNLSYPFNQQGIYDLSLTITDTNGQCSSKTTKKSYISIYPKPKAQFSSNPEEWSDANNPIFSFQNSSNIDKSMFGNGSITSAWKFGNARFDTFSTQFSPVFKAPGDDTGTYWAKLYVTSNYGCKDTFIKKLIIISKLQVFMPTSFSPDESGPEINNRYYIHASNYKSAWIRIYNRWGEKLYESTDLSEGWGGSFKGKHCMDGVYVVIADIRDFNGYHNLYKETIHLLR